MSAGLAAFGLELGALIPMGALAIAGLAAATPWRAGAVGACVLAALAGAGLSVWRALSEPGLAALAAAGLGLGAAAAMLVAAARLPGEMPREKHGLTAAILLVAIAGLYGTVAADSLFSLYLWLELTWLALIAAAAQGGSRDRGGGPAALGALIQLGVGGALFLFGAGLVVGGTGAASLTSLPEALAAQGLTRPTLVGLALMTAGLAVKAGLPPLHLWAAPLLSRGPGSVAALVGTLGPLCAGLALLRLIGALGGAVPALALAAAGLGVAGALIGSLQAMAARDFRRMVAHGLGAQIGVALVAAGLGGAEGVGAALFHLFNLIAIGLVLTITAAALPAPSPLTALDGLLRRAPLSAAALVVGLLSLIGAPLTAGFLSKWRMIESLLAAGYPWAASGLIVVALASVFYCGRTIERVVFRAQAPETGGGPLFSWAAVLTAPALFGAVGACVYFGLDARGALVLAMEAAAAIVPPAPDAPGVAP